METGFILINMGIIIGMLSMVFYNETMPKEKRVSESSFYLLFVMGMIFDFIIYPLM